MAFLILSTAPKVFVLILMWATVLRYSNEVSFF